MQLAVVAVLALAGCQARETVVMIQEEKRPKSASLSGQRSALNVTNSSSISCIYGYADADRCVVKCPAGIPPSLHVTP